MLPELMSLALLTLPADTPAAAAPTVHSDLIVSEQKAAPAAGEPVAASDSLATKLANPVSDLISVPFQFNYDCCFGPEDGARYTLNIQPVIPFKLTPDLSLVVRTIIPIIDQEPTTSTSGDHFGLGDVTQTFFFAPPGKNGLTWAIGPAFLWPLATDNLGSDKWGVGPSALILKQKSGMTVGMLANHIWSYAGDDTREDISTTFLQPFVSYTWPSTTGVSLNIESSYDWKGEEWTVPLNAGISHIYTFGKQKVQLGVFGRVYLAAPEEGPEWGLRFVATFLIPG